MDLEAFRGLLTDEGRNLLALVQDIDPTGEPLAMADLRRVHPAALVAAAVEQVRLRRKAAAKFGRHASRMYFTADSVELSSHLAVSEYKLHRVLHEIGVVMIDAMSLGSGADAHVLGWSHCTGGVDGDQLTVEIAAANRTGMDEPMLSLTCAEITEFDSQGEAVFIDLMRPTGPGRQHDPEEYDPPLSWALDRVRETGLGWIRLAPGIADQAIPGLGGADEAEWISYEGQIQEAVLWFGLDAPRTTPAAPIRKATLLPAGVSLVGCGLPRPAVITAGRYLYVPDCAVVHARLLAEVAQDVAGGLLDGGDGLLTADELHHTPFATPYEITGVLPFDSGTLKTMLRQGAAGRVTVTEAAQGLGIDPDEYRHDLTPQEAQMATVFVTGPAGRPTMLTAGPVPAGGPPRR